MPQLILGSILVFATVGPAMAESRDRAAAEAPWLHPDMAGYGVTLDNVETISTGRLLALIDEGYYRPAKDSDLWPALAARRAAVEGTANAHSSSAAPPFETNVRVNSATSGTQAEASMDSDAPTGNIYVGWNHGNTCGYSLSEDDGKTWSQVETYNKGTSWCGDTVIVAHGGVMWRLAMSSVSGGAQEDISKSTDGGKTWGPWIKANPTTSTNDKPWMDFDGSHIYIAVYDSGPINFFKSDDDGATWKPKKNLGNGQGNCVLAGNNGVVLVGWTHNNAKMMRSTDYGGNFTQVATMFTQGGEGSSPRTGSLAMCAADTARKNMYYTWTASEGSGNRKTFVMASTDEGATWGAPVRVTQSTDRQEHASVDVSADGVVHVAWQEFVGGKVYEFYSNSSDQGKTWLTPVEISDQNGNVDTSFMGHYAQVDASANNRIGYVFGDDRTGDVDLYYGAYWYKGGGGGGGGIARVEVTPATATINADQTLQLSAKAYDSANQQVNASFAWTASSGTVDTTGLFTPQTTGTAAVTATAGGKSGAAQVTVTPGAPIALTVLPGNPSIAADQTLRFSAEATDAKGNKWSLGSATWAVSGGAGAGSIDASGLYTPDRLGTYTIEASDAGSGLKATTSVIVVPGAVAVIAIDPPAAQITSDETQQFTASAADLKGNPVTASFAWSATQGTVVAGLYTPGKTGSHTVQATAGGKTGTATVEVSPGALASILVSPGGVSITADDTQQFTARGLDSKSNEVPVVPSWSVEDGEISASGVFTPQRTGEWRVTASQGGVSGSIKVTVTPGALAALNIDPASVAVPKGESRTFKLEAADAKGNAIVNFQAEWRLSGDAIGSVDKNGKFTASSAGEATVQATATANGGSASAEARVSVPGGIFDLKGGGQLPMLLLLMIAVVVAVGAAAALASRRRRTQAAAWPPEAGRWPQTDGYPAPQPAWDPQAPQPPPPPPGYGPQ